MSLALFAAEFNNEDNIKKQRKSNRSCSIKKMMNKKQIMNNKLDKFTNKKQISGFTKTDKVQEALQAIHSTLEDDEDDENNYNVSNLENFEPIEAPISASTERISSNDINNIVDTKENERIESFENYFKVNDENPEEEQSSYATQYYDQYIPPTHLNYKGYAENKNIINTTSDLDKKINYLIELIEQQKGEKTDNVTEEILLYGLVGVFVIYVVDSFVNIGKYKR
tara:strand:- start:1228 stop:1902 length:675 start_codon:yes stop_codon:yes gene_type:complete